MPPVDPLPAPPVHPARLVYLGTPEAAVPPLRALVAAGHDIALVVSRPDKRRGRGGALSPSPVKAAAVELGLPVTDELARATEVGADLGVVVAYGRIIPRALLEQLPMVNIHFSLLPRWRGAAPVERAILAGDERTGVCVMGVDEALDTGAVHRRAEVAIGPDETAAELRARLAELGAGLVVEALAVGLGTPEPQVGEPTYAAKLAAEEARIDWTQPTAVLQRQVRVGGAWTTWRGKRLKVWAARPAGPSGAGAGEGTGLAPGELRDGVVGTGDGALALIEVQPEGKGRLAAATWSNGARPQPAERLGEP